ncbi:MAG: hypothetical protein KGL53_10645, partial [Elusimicrobia bacterium]|nr:hypothetical protein [Elusimicrobiota bacterium]
PAGAFLVDAASSVVVALRRSDELLSGRRSLVAQGVPPAEAAERSLRLPAAAYPASLLEAVAATPPGVTPAGPYYDVELGSGTYSRLAKAARLTLSYSAGQDPAALNVYWYDSAANAYILQQDVTGASSQVDAVDRTVSLQVDHLSTYVLFKAGAPSLAGSAYDGGDLTAYNFPNPFDLSLKTVTPIHGSGPVAVRGTMVRVAVPSGLGGAGRLMVFSVAGERVRTIDLGTLSGGRSYYQSWDGTNDAGSAVASGLYIAEVKVGDRRTFFKMAVLR